MDSGVNFSILGAALLAQWLVFLMLFTLVLRTRAASLWNPAVIYLAFHGLVFVIRPTLVAFAGFDFVWQFMQRTLSQTVFLETLFASSLFAVIFVGSILWTTRGVTQVIACPSDFRIFRTDRIALGITWLLLGPLAIYSLMTTSSLGELSLVSSNVEMERVGGAAIYTNTTGYIVEAKTMLGALILITVFLFRFSKLSLLLAALYIVYRLSLGWGRWATITLIMSLAVMYAISKGRKWPAKAILIQAVWLLPIFWALGENRQYLQQQLFGSSSSAASAIFLGRAAADKNPLDTLDFANFDFLAYIISVVPEETQTYTYGTQYLQVFTEPVPRIFWPEKPVGAPIQFFDLNDYGNFNGLTNSIIGDAWMSGGWLGVLISAPFWGTLLGILYRRANRGPVTAAKILYVAIVFPLFIQFYRDGGIVSILKFLLYLTLPLLTWRMVVVILQNVRPQKSALQGISGT